MKLLTNLLIVVSAWIPVLSSHASGANITNVVWTGTSGTADPFGYLTIPNPGAALQSGAFWGDQTGPVRMGLNFYTDNPADPTFTLSGSTVNSSSFVWTSYVVDLTMSSLFSIDSAHASTPADWTAAIFQPGSPAAGLYSGQIVFSAGTPVIIGGNFDFSFQLSFNGGLPITLTQTVTPVPEPAGLGLLAAGLLSLAGLKIVRKRQSA